MKALTLTLALLLTPVASVYAGEQCMVVHGRARLYSGDLQLRIWSIGTHHEYAPVDSSWDRVIQWLAAGVPDSEKSRYTIPASAVDLYADFLICPTEPFVEGSVQQAEVKIASHRRYVRTSDQCASVTVATPPLHK